MNASQIIKAAKVSKKETGSAFVKFIATKKIKGHAEVTVSVPDCNIYDCWVWGSGKSSVLNRIDLRAKNADEELARYFK